MRSWPRWSAASPTIPSSSTSPASTGTPAASYFTLHGYDYSRKKGHADDELSPWYNKKNFWMMHREPFNEKLFSHDFVTLCADDLSALMPFYRYFLQVYGYGA